MDNDELLKTVKEMLGEIIETHIGYIKRDLQRFDRNFQVLFNKHDEAMREIANLNSAKTNHEKRLEKLENKSKFNTFISGVFGFLGGLFWQASRWFYNK